MPTETVDAFLDRVASDEVFASQLADLRDDPTAVVAFAARAGFDLDPAQMQDALVDRFGDQLTEEQLAAIAGGLGGGAIAAIAVVGVGGSIAVAAACAAA